MSNKKRIKLYFRSISLISTRLKNYNFNNRFINAIINIFCGIIILVVCTLAYNSFENLYDGIFSILTFSISALFTIIVKTKVKYFRNTNSIVKEFIDIIIIIIMQVLVWSIFIGLCLFLYLYLFNSGEDMQSNLSKSIIPLFIINKFTKLPD